MVASIQGLKVDSGFERSSQEVIVPIRYDGEDLAQVAELQGLSVADVIRKHYQSVWNVAFIGFAPGFAYMSSPDKPFTDIPRLTVPRKKYRQARWAWLENTLVFTQKTVRVAGS